MKLFWNFIAVVAFLKSIFAWNVELLVQVTIFKNFKKNVQKIKQQFTMQNNITKSAQQKNVW